MSAFSVGVSDGLSAHLTALWVSRDESQRAGKGLVLCLFTVSAYLFCMLADEFESALKACTFAPISRGPFELGEPALLDAYMSVGRYRCAEGVTFNPDGDLWLLRSTASNKNRSQMSRIRRDVNSGQWANLPISLASCPIHCHFAPFIPAHTQHPTPAGPIGSYCRKQEREQSRRKRRECGGAGGGCLVCSVTSC